MSLPNINDWSFLDITVKAVPYIFWVAVAAFLTVGGILDYHWRTYGVGLIRLLHFRLLFIVSGLILLAVMYYSYHGL